MKNKILLTVVIILSFLLLAVIIYAKKNNYMIPIPPEENTKPITIRLLNEQDNTITEINLEDYIVGVVAGEMPATFEVEALKAQAVAARTFAMYKKETRNLDYDLIMGTKDQVYKDNKTLLGQWGLSFFNNYLKIRDAVKETQNQIITYDNKIINAFYFSMSNGYTENCELVFKQKLPYLSSVPSLWDNETISNYEFTKTIQREDFCKSLDIPCETINITEERSSTNRINTITINGKTFKGTEIRTKLNLRSTDFTIIEKNDKMEITTKGFGHGVGMSQYGANGMAKDGYNYEEILKHYYQNTQIQKINV